MFDIQKIAKVLASKRLKNIPTEYFASYIGFLLLNFNFDINKKIGFKKCFLGFHTYRRKYLLNSYEELRILNLDNIGVQCQKTVQNQQQHVFIHIGQ